MYHKALALALPQGNCKPSQMNKRSIPLRAPPLN
jgi:hypothetical protein